MTFQSQKLVLKYWHTFSIKCFKAVLAATVSNWKLNQQVWLEFFCTQAWLALSSYQSWWIQASVSIFFFFFVCSKGYAKFDSNLIFILPADQNIEANQLVETFSNWGPDFNINFDIIVDQVPKGWHNLLHFTTGADCCDRGTRIPGMATSAYCFS